MKKFFLFKLLTVLVFMIFSCDNNMEETISEEASEGKRVVGLRFADSKRNIASVRSINMKIFDISGEEVFSKSFTNPSESMKFDGIPDVPRGVVVFTAYGTDMNNPFWKGKVSGVSFEKGETTKLEVMLYPLNPQIEKSDGSYSAPYPHGSLPDEMSEPRFAHSATLLRDGRILIAGGFSSCQGENCFATNGVEIIDPESGRIESLPPMNQPRAFHKAVLVNDSIVFIGGVQKLVLDETNSVADMPELPLKLETASTGVELYRPTYPKHNLVLNGENKVPTEVSYLQDDSVSEGFYPYQSYVTVPSSSDGKWDIYLLGGLSSGEALSSVYKVTISENSEGETPFTSTTPQKIEDSDALPGIVVPTAGKNSVNEVFAIGGRSNDSVSIAHTVSPDISAWETENIPNMFFAETVEAMGKFYSFGGIINNGDSFSNTDAIYEFSSSQEPVSSGSYTYNNVFSSAVYDEKTDAFYISGGTNSILNDFKLGDSSLKKGTANDFFITVPRSNLNGTININSGRLGVNRLLHTATLDTALDNNGLVFIAGGIGGLNIDNFDNIKSTVNVKYIRD